MKNKQHRIVVDQPDKKDRIRVAIHDEQDLGCVAVVYFEKKDVEKLQQFFDKGAIQKHTFMATSLWQ